LHLTLDASFKAELDELTALLGHEVPNGDLRAVLLANIRPSGGSTSPGESGYQQHRGSDGEGEEGVVVRERIELST
jgi:hypothetical protein